MLVECGELGDVISYRSRTSCACRPRTDLPGDAPARGVVHCAPFDAAGVHIFFDHTQAAEAFPAADLGVPVTGSEDSDGVYCVDGVDAEAAEYAGLGGGAGGGVESEELVAEDDLGGAPVLEV